MSSQYTTALSPRQIVRPAARTEQVIEKQIDLSKLVRLSNDSKLGIYRVPTDLHKTPVWQICTVDLDTRSIGTLLAALRNHPSQVWLKDDKAVLMYADKTFPEFCDDYNLDISGPVGKRDKRMSRLWRAQALFSWISPRKVKIHYVKRGLVRNLSQDGANWISRTMVNRLAEERIETEKLGPRESKLLRTMARHCKRVEITVVNDRGQFKGHALVTDTDQWDLQLIEGSEKKELKTRKNAKIYISVEPKHVSTLWFDRQSFANLSVDGCFNPQNLEEWMREYCDYQLDCFDHGRYVEMITEMGEEAQWATDGEKLLNYPVFEYVLSGGDPKWFAATTRQALKAGLKGAERRGETNGSFILPGANYYVMPTSAAKDAGLERPVKRGEAFLDTEYATIWINDVDLVTDDPSFQDVAALEKYVGGDAKKLDALREAHPGLMQVWSGSDDDDMIRALPFHDREDRLLCWRSPNQLGQFAVLKLAEGSDLPQWCGGTSMALLDSTKLPNPDRWEKSKVLGLIQPYQGEKVLDYNLSNIFDAAKRMIDSSGAVGLHCLALRFAVGTLGHLPDEVPAEVSDIIDAMVKDFADCSQVNEHNREFLRGLCDQSMEVGGMPIPTRYAEELRKLFANDENPPALTSADNWVDACYQATHDVLADYWDVIEARAMEARPPMELYEAGLKTGDAGLGLKKVYGSFWREVLGVRNPSPRQQAARQAEIPVEGDVFEGETDADKKERQFDRVRERCMDYLKSHFPADKWPMVMVGGLAMVYAQALDSGDLDGVKVESWISDQAFWQLGQKNEDGVGREPGIAEMTIQGLREIGLIGLPMIEDGTGKVISKETIKAVRAAGDHQYDEMAGKVKVYDAFRETAKTTIVAVRGAWFNYGKITGILPKSVQTMGDAHRYEDKVKQAKSSMAGLDLEGCVFRVGDAVVAGSNGKDERLPALFGVKGNLLGTMNRNTAVGYLPATMKVVSSTIDERDMLWLICEE